MKLLPAVIASEAKQSIGTAQSVKMDCFVAEPVIGRAFRATRWLLAMTKTKSPPASFRGARSANPESRATTSRFRIGPSDRPE